MEGRRLIPRCIGRCIHAYATFHALPATRFNYVMHYGIT